ncbi:MAG: rRNA maturation RNase YbeY [Peptococcaceae bacterium]|jgi:probable rRNA maturation factor|nr:rRNA maturation RNase YbeY [Peptococcaceae bacterium]MBQ2003862.1 rRNA maturation RNase YbeY [Peptococcaceae bacterium]MBQ2021279.1 rRNA maturation RNase YbeY [Peptococcaceae bacterium]MBQ2369785.1 rRNA maturation RNase YbeY [Peptococcaceae bacterium]MBQ2432262.1 rRNA maturation RNase YbeY [Peptococcaceae bacterium]
MTVFITNEQDKIEIPAEWEEKINQVAAICLREEQLPEDVEVDLLFVDNEAIREMNLEYRDKDSATDVLSFPMYEPDEEIDDEEEVLLGDIVISLERAQEQCEEYGHSLEREVMYLLVHGLLHLAGYDHMEEEDKKVMRAQEEKLLAQIGAIR